MKLLLVFLGLLGLTIAQQCQPDEHECDTGRCVPDWWVCDGDNDCGDGSDERNCPPPTTPTTTTPTTPRPCEGFTCDTGRCVPSSYVCDGDNDCDDWSDETNCPNCRGVVCDTNNKCIPERSVCDAEADCDDGMDEYECPCPEFTCDNGKCIADYYVCDGKITTPQATSDNDCGDGSDEVNCTMTGRKLRHPINAKPKKRIPVGGSSIQKLMKLAKQGTNAKKERQIRQRKTKSMNAFKHYRPQK